MSKVKGMLMTCDRCGFQEFVEAIGEKETDGGYTRFNEFAPSKEPWGSIDIGLEYGVSEHKYDLKDICPSCLRAKDEAKKKFWRYVTNDKEGSSND